MEVAKLLLKRQGITKGKWTLGIAFNLAATIAGPTPESARPTMLVGVDKLILQKADPNTPPAMIVDAAELSDD
jgi:hypothetical protein